MSDSNYTMIVNTGRVIVQTVVVYSDREKLIY